MTEARLNDAYNGMLEANLREDKEAYDEAQDRFDDLKAHLAIHHPERAAAFRPLIDTERLKPLL